MATRRIHITLGTAGHIDHGKTALVRNLTGCETDTLKEEKERGMSIDLGFAPCRIEGLEAGLVDVPGHENFVRTMVAGATGMDGVILVVAADDGVMPQTREHLDILCLLGVRHGVVALTKIDRVEAGRVEEVAAEVRGRLRGTFLEPAEICPVSNTTFEGLNDLRAALVRLMERVPPRGTGGVFRLPVDRAFAVKGYGAVVTGIPAHGRVAVGAELEMHHQGGEKPVAGRLRAVQVYREAGETAQAGECAALNVPQWDHARTRRGDVVAAPGCFVAGEWLVCRLALLGREGLDLRNGGQVRVHTGTVDVPGTVYLEQGRRMNAGDEGLVQVRVAAPIVAGPGDPFLLRVLGPARTIGGGRIVAMPARRLRRQRPEAWAAARARAEALGDPIRLVESCLRAAVGGIAREPGLEFEAKLRADEVRAALGALEAGGVAVAVPGQGYIHGETAARARAAVLAAVGAFHREHPESPGLARESGWVPTLGEGPPLAPALAEWAVAALLGDGALVRDGATGRIALPEHTARVTDADRLGMEAVERAFREHRFAPPDETGLAAAGGVGVEEARRLTRLLEERGRLVRVGAGLLFHAEAVAEARARIEEHMRREGRLESVKFKYLVETTRKFALPLLDYFDRIGVTRRVGNTRFPRR